MERMNDGKENSQAKILVFNRENYRKLCDQLALKEEGVCTILDRYGYPPLLEREKGFEGLVKIILEQQVSLASALAVYNKLKKKIHLVTPENITNLTDADFKSCGFSRQKTSYVNHLAHEVLENGLDIVQLSNETDETVRKRLIKVKGIGNWTCDVFLLMCLNRLDIFPIGDLALINSMKENGLINRQSSKEKIVNVIKKFKPFRSIFAMILWHAYIEKRKKDVTAHDLSAHLSS